MKYICGAKECHNTTDAPSTYREVSVRPPLQDGNKKLATAIFSICPSCHEKWKTPSEQQEAWIESNLTI